MEPRDLQVLVVDNDPPSRELLAEMLSSMEVTVHTAPSGLEAIASVCAALGGPLPALVISADTSAEARAEVQASGHLLLAKPVEPVRLRAALAHLLRPH